MKYCLIMLYCMMLCSCDGADIDAQKLTGESAGSVSDIDIARASWHDSNISRYRMHIFRDTVTSANHAYNDAGQVTSENSLVLVNDEQVLESYQLAEESYLDYEKQSSNVSTAMTVEELFMMIDHAAINETLIGSVNYHELGYPLDFQYMDNDGNLVSIHVENFYDPQAEVAQLEAKKTDWIERRNDNYSMVLTLNCLDFCQTMSAVYSNVVDRQCVSKGYYETPPVNIALDYFPSNMVDLYDKAIAAASTLDAQFVAGYHPVGYLQSYHLGSPFGFSGGDIGFNVGKLEFIE